MFGLMVYRSKEEKEKVKEEYLFEAARDGDVVKCEELISKGVNLECRDEVNVIS